MSRLGPLQPRNGVRGVPQPSAPRIGDGPVTLHAVIREAIGRGLRYRYEPERQIPHHLLTLLMQLNEDERRSKAAS